ncbi:MAG TPA: cell division protein ZapA [Gemmatimonadaceae bacterium]|nr:cell division protein ZapA [Gemmatimonadaceae bacterium]
MSEKRHVVKVTIMGEEYTLRTDEEPEHAVAVAAYLDSAIQRIANSGTVVEANRAAILAALQITDELFKLRENVQQSDDALRALSGEIRRLLPPAKRGRESEFVSTEHPAQMSQPARAD